MWSIVSVVSIVAIGALSLVALVYSATMTSFSLGFMGLILLTIPVSIGASEMYKQAKKCASLADEYMLINEKLTIINSNPRINFDEELFTRLKDLANKDCKEPHLFRLVARFLAFQERVSQYQSQLQNVNQLSTEFLKQKQTEINKKIIAQKIIPMILQIGLVIYLIQHPDCQDTLNTLGKINERDECFELNDQNRKLLSFQWIQDNAVNNTELEKALFPQKPPA